MAAFFVLPDNNIVTKGVAFVVTVIALDDAGEFDTAYPGTIAFTSSDGAAALPGDSTLTAGEGTFNVTLNTVGGHTVTATDTATASIRGVSPPIFCQEAPITSPVPRSSITVPWTEEWGDNSQSAYSLSYEDSQITQEIIVRMEDMGQAVEDILGYHYRAGDFLIRRPPLQHALFPSMYATKIARILPQGAPAEGNFKDATIYNTYSNYEQVRILIVYQNLPYNPYHSNRFPDVRGTEAGRYCARYFSPTAENISINHGPQLGYLEGPSANEPLPNDVRPIRLVPKADIQFIWYNVPDEYLVDSSGIPVNIYGYPLLTSQLRIGQTTDGAIGKINKTRFLGYPPQTLLLMPPRITPVLFPAHYKVFSGRQESVRLWNVEFNFRYINPTRDPGFPDSSLRGHNLVPHPATPYWYGAAFTKDINGTPLATAQPLFRVFEFRNLFLAANAVNMWPN